MSLLSKEGLLARIRRGKDARAKLVESNLAKGIAYQIRATREAQEMTQEKLAQITGMSQNNISRLENPAYGKHTTSSLKRIAEALDVAVIIRLVPFSQYVNWLSGVSYLDLGLRPEAMAVPSFEKEEEKNCFNSKIEYWQVTSGPNSIAVARTANSGSYGNQTAGEGSYKQIAFGKAS